MAVSQHVDCLRDMWHHTPVVDRKYLLGWGIEEVALVEAEELVGKTYETLLGEEGSSVLAMVGLAVYWDVDDEPMARQPDYSGTRVNQQEDPPYRLRTVVEAAEQKHSAEHRQLALIRIEDQLGLGERVRTADASR